MEKILVDTDVISFSLKRDSRAALYAPHLLGKLICVSFMTVAELYRWTLARNWGKQRIDQLKAHLESMVLVNYDDAIAWEWAHLTSVPGRPMPMADAWVAATALRHGVPLVTHNRRHYEHIAGLTVVCENPGP